MCSVVVGHRCTDLDSLEAHHRYEPVTRKARLMLAKRWGLERSRQMVTERETAVVINALVYHLEAELGLGRNVGLPNGWRILNGPTAGAFKVKHSRGARRRLNRLRSLSANHRSSYRILRQLV